MISGARIGGVHRGESVHESQPESTPTVKGFKSKNRRRNSNSSSSISENSNEDLS